MEASAALAPPHTSTPTTGDEFRMVEHALCRPSPLNPRQTFDKAALAELAQSMRDHGIIEPLIVRRAPKTSGFEIVAGERRWRAAQIAGLEQVPVIVKDLSDGAALEVLVIENNQREDVNALEEGEGYRRLLKFGYNLEKLAERLGRSKKYIYDRIKLMALVPIAQTLLRETRITAGHAILLARLKPEEQKRVLDPDDGGLFVGEGRQFDPLESRRAERARECAQAKDPLAAFAELKPVSVRELETYIDDHIRFDRTDPIVQDLFPETAKAVATAVDEREKVIQLTYDNYVQPEAKEGNEERIWGPQSWKRADRKHDSKPCEFSITGVIVVGPHRGEAFKVCVNKEKCKVHWEAERRDRRRRAKEQESAGARRIRDNTALNQARWEKERREADAREALFRKAHAAVLNACAAKVKTAKVGPLLECIRRGFEAADFNAAAGRLGQPKTLEDVARVVALAQLASEADAWNYRRSPKDVTRHVQRIGVDLATILKQHQPEKLVDDAKHAQTSARKKKPATKR